MIKHTFAAIGIGSFFSFGIGLPLAAQIDNPADTLDADNPEIINNDDAGVDFPAGTDTPVDGGLPGSDLITPSGLIRLEVDGESRYYAPVNIDETQLGGTRVPTYNLDTLTGGTLTDDAGVTGDGPLDNVTVTGEDNQPLEDTNVEPDRDSLIIYPPADSIEDLEPEDILE